MATLITSGGALGLRALGAGGRTARSAYEQIVRLLRQSLGAEHASLFSEPSSRSGALDWFTNFDADARPIRLSEAQPGQRESARATLERLVREIEGKAVVLQKSDRQDERILGDILSNALEVPDENAIYLVGAQPVLTFWGYVRDQGRPAENPLRTIIRRKPQGASEPASKNGAPIPPPLPPGLGADPPGAPPAQPAFVEPAAPERVPPPFWTPPALAVWGIFAALLSAIGVMLLKSCALGLPMRSPAGC